MSYTNDANPRSAASTEQFYNRSNPIQGDFSW